MTRNELITNVKSYIYQNNENGISGDELQNVMINMVNSLYDALEGSTGNYLGNFTYAGSLPTPLKSGYYILNNAINYSSGNISINGNAGDYLSVMVDNGYTYSIVSMSSIYQSSLNLLSSELNIDKLYPLSSGYYTLSTAIAAVATQFRSVNAKITFKSAANTVETWVFTSTIDGWSSTSNWQPFGSVEQVRSQNTNTAPSSKLFDDLIIKLQNLGAVYKGVATPTTNPGTPDQKVFYFATTAGTYNYFNNIVVNDDEIAILCWDNSWNKQKVSSLSNKSHSILKNLSNEEALTFIRRIEIIDYNYPVKDIVPFRLFHYSDNTYKIFFVNPDFSTIKYVFVSGKVSINTNYLEIPIGVSGYKGTMCLWLDLSSIIDETITGDVKEHTLSEDYLHNIITDECYVNSNPYVGQLQEDVGQLQEDVEGETLLSYTSDNISDFIVGYYLPRTATSFSEDTLVANVNLCYKHFSIPQSEGKKFAFAYCALTDQYPYETLFWLDSNNQVISYDTFFLAGKKYEIPENAVYICVCFLKSYIPFGIEIQTNPKIIDTIVPIVQQEIKPEIKQEILNEIDDYLIITQSHQERMARDICYELEKRNPFEWKIFTKRCFAFMNDDANQDMTQYYKVCRDRRVPYCHAFIRNIFTTYSYTGNDANRKNLIKNPAVGTEYTFTKDSNQTYLRLYIDRQYTLGFPINITVNGTQHIVNSADNARILIGNTTSVTFTITSIGNLTDGRTNFINIIATADSSDSVSTTVSWTTQELLKNIVFDFGEILAHNSPVINMWDLKEAEKLFAEYLFEDPRKIDEILEEEHCKGAILPGGPNSNRGMNTELGQHYCCRYLLYCDYYGTTPQYMIQRTSYGYLSGGATDYATAKENTLTWLSGRQNGFYPLFTHSEKSPEIVSGIIDAILESENIVCSNWRVIYEENS